MASRKCHESSGKCRPENSRESFDIYDKVKDVLNRSLPKPCDFSGAFDDSDSSGEDSYCLVESSDQENQTKRLSTPISQLSLNATRFTFPSVSDSELASPLKPKFFTETLKMERWISKINRQMAMLTFLSNSEEGRLRSHIPLLEPKQTLEARRPGKTQCVPLDRLYAGLMGLHSRVKKQNEKKRTSFFVVMDLVQILRKFDSSLLLNASVQQQVEQILTDWITGASFAPENLPKLAGLLRNYFEGQEKRVMREEFLAEPDEGRDNSDWTTLINLWRSTFFFTDERLAKINDGQIIEGVYFDVLKDVLTGIVARNAEDVPKFVDIGHECLGEFEMFMSKFNIPHSGPYKRDMAGDKAVLVYFISSVNADDKIVNGGLPLYGAFDYGTYGIDREGDRDRHNAAHNSKHYLRDTPPIPNWLIHLPPLFHKSFGEFQAHFKTI